MEGSSPDQYRQPRIRKAWTPQRAARALALTLVLVACLFVGGVAMRSARERAWCNRVWHARQSNAMTAPPLDITPREEFMTACLAEREVRHAGPFGLFDEFRDRSAD